MANVLLSQTDVGMSVCESMLQDCIDPKLVTNEVISDHYLITLDGKKHARKVVPEYVYDFVYNVYPRLHKLHHKVVDHNVQHVNVSVEMLESIIDRGLNKIIGRINHGQKNHEPAPVNEVVPAKNKKKILVIGFNSDQEAAIAADKDPNIRFKFINVVRINELNQLGKFDLAIVAKFSTHSAWESARKKANKTMFAISPNEAIRHIKEYMASK